jgi:hypothetical protein
MKKWLRQFMCKHIAQTAWLTVSGYGYTEYKICFCKQCEKLLWKQTGEQR